MALGHESRRLCAAPDPEIVRMIQESDSKRYPDASVPRCGKPLESGERRYHAACRDNARNERRRLDPRSRAANRDGVKKWRIRHAPILRAEKLIEDLVDEYTDGLIWIRRQHIHAELKHLYDLGCANEDSPLVVGWSLTGAGAAILHANVITHRNPEPGTHQHDSPSDRCPGQRAVHAAIRGLPSTPRFSSSYRNPTSSAQHWESLVEGYRVDIEPVTLIDTQGEPDWSMHGLRIVLLNRTPRAHPTASLRRFLFADGHDKLIPPRPLPMVWTGESSSNRGGARPVKCSVLAPSYQTTHEAGKALPPIFVVFGRVA